MTVTTELAAAVARRAAWNGDGPSHRPAPAEPTRCAAKDCEELGSWFAVAHARTYCEEHAKRYRLTFPDRRIVRLIICTRCSRQAPSGGAVVFEGETARRLCRECADLVRGLLEGRP